MGPPVFDDIFGGKGPRTTAVGGTQRIRLLTSDGAAAVLELPFDAEGTGVIEIADVSPPDVVIRATGAGEGYLRILEAGTSDLYDRTLIKAAAVTQVRWGLVDEIAMNPAVPDGGWALFAGGKATLGASLRGDDPDDALVDQSMVFQVESGGAAGAEPLEWDRVEVIPEAGGEVIVTAKLGDGTSRTQAFPITDKVDKIERAATVYDGLQGDGNTVAPKQGLIACFRAFDGARAVGGLTWAFSSDKDVILDPADGESPCTIVSSNVIGIHTVAVEAGGQKLLFNFEVVASAK